MTKPSDYGTATQHAAAVILARATLIDELEGKLRRSSRESMTEVVDYLLTRGYLTSKFYTAYSEGNEEPVEL